MWRIAWMAVRAGGIRAVEPFYQLESGVTLLQPFWYMIYYIVVLLFLGLAAVLSGVGHDAAQAVIISAGWRPL